MKIKSLVLAVTSFTLFSHMALAESTIRVSDDAKALRTRQVEVSDVIRANSAVSYQLVIESSQQIALLRNNQVEYSALLNGLLISMSAQGEAIEDSISEVRSQKVKVTKKQMAKLKKKFAVLKAAQDRNDRFVAYLRALAVCVQMVPINNETLQMTTMGIQSQWCVQMRKTEEAKLVAQMLVWHSSVTGSKLDDSFGNAKVINEAIQSLVDTKSIKMK